MEEVEENFKYLVLAEIEKRGFLVKFYNDYDRAKQVADLTYELIDGLEFAEMSEVEAKLSCFASYEINGNENFTGNSMSGVSNGTYSVNILKIDLNNFRLTEFILERKNHSSVFPYEIFGEKLNKILQLFPRPDFVAN